MAATAQEIVATARQLCREQDPYVLQDLRWADGSAVTTAEVREILGLAIYEVQRRARRRWPAQRKALRLLRRYLTSEQTRQMRAGRCFYLTGTSGATYRLFPGTGVTKRVERHGSRLYETHQYCLHDFPACNALCPDRTEGPMPPADVTLAHLLWLACDEPGFLAAANCRPSGLQMWDGDYLRRIYRRRRADKAAADAAAQEGTEIENRSNL